MPASVRVAWCARRVPAPLRSFPVVHAGNAASGREATGKGRNMYIGVGTLVVILIIVLIIYFVRRA